jgi:hypothetical protein
MGMLDHGERRLARLPRRLFRKIVVERSPDGWRARIVGFDARFYLQSKSREYRTRHQAIQAAAAASLVCGLPVIVIETLVAASGPGEAA